MIPGWERCYLVMLATTSIQRRDMIHLSEAAVGDSRHDYRHEIRHEVGLGISSRIYMRPTRILSSSHISPVRQWNPFLSRACCCVLHVTCILVHPRVFTCTRMRLRVSAWCRLFPARISRFQKKSFLSRASRASRALHITCLVLSHPPEYIRVHLRASTRIHTHQRRSCVRTQHKIENCLNISDYM